MDSLSNFKDRIRKKSLLSKIMSQEEASQDIQPNMLIGCSGFTPVGYPKVIPAALAKRAETEGPVPLTLWCGASSGREIDEELASSGCIKRRYPYQSNKVMRSMINEGKIEYSDIHLSMGGQNLRYGFYGKIDVALIEAAAITENGGIVPSTAVGDAAAYVRCANKVIIEINLTQPAELEGMHDIFIPQDPPYRKPLPLRSVRDRIGVPFIECGAGKILGIVPSSVPDCGVLYDKRCDPVSEKIAANVLNLLDLENKRPIIPINQLPLQFGVGRVANIVLSELAKTVRGDIKIYSEVLQDAVLDLIDAGKLAFASGTSLTMTKGGLQRLFQHLEDYKEKILLRSEEISNSPEIIRRLGVIAVNTALEADIFGNVNSSHNGYDIVNGIGGSGDFARNAYLTIFVCPSLYKTDGSSNIVFNCSHVDHTEHDVDVIITEYGVADLRGLTRTERAKEIIGKCAHPSHRCGLYKRLRSMRHCRRETGA